MAQPLSDLEIQRALSGIPGWQRRANALVKTITLRTFAQTIALVNRIAEEAERMNHHPDLDIRYNKLTCTLSSHDAGGITQRDLDLAAAIDRLAAD